LATTNNPAISIAHMIAPPKWSEPFQTPEFEEYTYIIKGKKQFIIEEDTIVLEAGQSIKNRKNTVFSTLIRLMNPVSTLPYALLHLTLTKFIAKNRNCQELNI
jgi:mannose-6-phosphate isomerase-like protein (cupin superfamily)